MHVRSIFRTVWRFNALLIAATGVVALLVGSYALLSIAKTTFRERQVTNVATATDTVRETRTPANTTIGHFSRIPGTPHLWAPIERRDHHSRSYYAKNAVNHVDHIFYDTANGRSHRLRNRDDGLIVETTMISENADRKAPPDALLVSIVETDTNGDGLLSHSDQRTLAIARPNGTNLTELMNGVERTLGWERLSAAETVPVVRVAGKVRALHIDTDNLKIIRQQPLSKAAAAG